LKEAWEHFLLDHISRKYPLMFLTKPKKPHSPNGYRSKKWEKLDENQTEGKICSEESWGWKHKEELLRRWKRRPYDTKTIIISLQKPKT
jgi:hypothetical protein